MPHPISDANDEISLSETTSFAPSDWTNDVFSLVKNDRTGKYVFRNLFQFENQNGCVIYGRRFRSVDNFISEQENKARTSQKTEQDVKLLLYYTCFWKPRMKKEKRKIF